MDILTPDAAGIARVVDLLRAGEVVGFPSDTVYGLAALAGHERAVRRVFEVKGRSFSQPLILMVAEPAWLEGWAHVDERARGYMERWWPGPLTLVLPAREGVGPPLTSASRPRTIAARIPDHEVALALLRAAGEALATTSANRSGEPPALTPLESAWVDGLAAVLDGGRAPGAVPSTLLDVSGDEPRVLRAGPVPAEALVSGRW
ncbi:MAG TPA: L-threonylcarbamoyladenylate synthase [Candidatus Dormibacteraeota bacterium]|nr:L-threonylcarbamoyladenylate synthase [Candidatus Dormibacteraeota bacterium]